MQLIEKYLRFTNSSMLLILSNLVAIGLAVWEHWNLPTIMWLYWWQSVTIGIFNFFRILKVKDISTEGLLINGKPAEPTKKTQRYIAFFFLAHYGGFHLAYMIFLFFMTITNTIQQIDIKWLLFAGLVFFGNHLFSFFSNYSKDEGKQNIGRMMFFPYARILPMHLTIIFGNWMIGSTATLIFFMVLKTIADLIMHLVEHKE